MGRYARRRSTAPAAVGIARARFLRALARVPEKARMSHRVAEDPRYLDRDRVVCRGRYLRLLWQSQSRDSSQDTGGENPGPAVPEAYPKHAESRVPGRLGTPRNPERVSARRCGIPDSQ